VPAKAQRWYSTATTGNETRSQPQGRCHRQLDWGQAPLASPVLCQLDPDDGGNRAAEVAHHLLAVGRQRPHPAVEPNRQLVLERPIADRDRLSWLGRCCGRHRDHTTRYGGRFARRTRGSRPRTDPPMTSAKTPHPYPHKTAINTMLDQVIA
jgi:hypothetical protein